MISVSKELEELVNFAVDTEYDDLPAAVVHETKLLLLDSIGTALAGITTDLGKIAIALARRLGGPPESSILGVGDRVSCCSAAFANGQLINALDYDAIMPGGHTPPYIIATSMAMAESTEASGKDLILAMALGFEIAVRVASAMQPPPPSDKQASRWQDRGGNASYNFGAAAGAGKLLKLDRDKMINALGTAGHLCQVLTWVRQTFSDHRHMAKYGLPGWQNTGGIMAVLLAEMGYMGDTTVFDPEHGFWKFCGYDAWHPEKITEGIGKAWSFTRVNYKPYPCCRVLHPALECFLEIIDQNNLMPEDIASVKVFYPQHNLVPVLTNRELTNIVDVQFGLPYVLAVAAHRLKPGVDWQDWDAVRGPKILEFAERVSLQVHPEHEESSQFEGLNFPSRVEVVAKGKTFSAEKILPRGAAVEGLQMTDDELVGKFTHNAARILTQDKNEEAVEALLKLETVDHVSELMSLVTM